MSLSLWLHWSALLTGELLNVLVWWTETVGHQRMYICLRFLLMWMDLDSWPSPSASCLWLGLALRVRLGLVRSGGVSAAAFCCVRPAGSCPACGAGFGWCVSPLRGVGRARAGVRWGPRGFLAGPRWWRLPFCLALAVPRWGLQGGGLQLLGGGGQCFYCFRWACLGFGLVGAWPGRWVGRAGALLPFFGQRLQQPTWWLGSRWLLWGRAGLPQSAQNYFDFYVYAYLYLYCYGYGY